MSDPASRYVTAALRHTAETRTGNSKLANRAYRDMMQALGEMRNSPDAGIHFLEHLTSQDQPSVVCWAAVHLLPDKPEVAVLALERVAQGADRLAAFSARVSLDEWKIGRLGIRRQP